MDVRYFGGLELHAFGPADVIFTEFKFSVVGGIVFGMPVLLQQFTAFRGAGDCTAGTAHG